MKLHVTSPLRVLFLVCLTMLLTQPVSAKANGSLRIAVHDAFYKVVSAAFAHNRNIELVKIRGDKLRFLVNWEKLERHYDMIIGLDPNSVPITKQKQFALVSGFSKQGKPQRFIPFCYAIIGFLCRRDTKTCNESLSKFVNSVPKRSLLLQNHTLSSLGKITKRWLQNIDEVDQKVLLITKGWGGAHKAFMAGQGQCMLGYLASARLLDSNDYKPILFQKTAHPIQIFSVAVMSKCESGTSRKISQYIDDVIAKLMSDDFQKSLGQAYVFPVKSGAEDKEMLALKPAHLDDQGLKELGIEYQ